MAAASDGVGVGGAAEWGVGMGRRRSMGVLEGF